MSDNLAADYADNIAADIQARTDAGAPFGWINRETEEWSGDEPEGWRTDADSEWDEASALDYMSDVLDIQYLVNGDRTYRSARILVALGGPTAWIDTRTGDLEVTWWSAPEIRHLPSDFISGLDDALEELWEEGA